MKPSNDYYDSGNSKYDLHDFEGAIEDYTKAIEIEPTDENAYYKRGLAKIEISEKESGCIDLSKASELGNESAKDELKHQLHPDEWLNDLSKRLNLNKNK